MPIGRIRWRRTWQPWLLSDPSFPSLTLTFFEIFTAIPSEYLILFTKSQNSRLSNNVNLYFAHDLMYRSLCFTKCNSFLIFISYKFIITLSVSLVLPSMHNRIPTTLSHIFFSICMTSVLCLNFNFGQYSNSKNMFFFVQFSPTSIRLRFVSWFLLLFPNITFSTFPP